MASVAELKRIVEKEEVKEILPFIVGLSKEERKFLSPEIKKLKTYYSKIIEDDQNRWSSRGTPEQSEVLGVASFFCQKRKDFEKDVSTSILEIDLLKSLLEHYVPIWFSDYINSLANQEYFPYYISFDWLMKMKDMGAVNPTPELIVGLITRLIIEPNNKTHEARYVPERLVERPEILETYFWYLFTYESDIHWTDQYTRFEKGTNIEGTSWSTAINNYSEDGSIDRIRVLQESLNATNRNFNKSLSGWFIKLFVLLKPTEEELLIIQSELFGVLSCPHSKPINEVLKIIKKLVSNKRFDQEGFISNLSTLLASDVKSVVKSTLMIVEKLIKTSKVNKQELCIEISQALLHEDKELQLRAAKIIVSSGDSSAATLLEVLESYKESMFSEVKLALVKFLTEDGNEESSDDEQVLPVEQVLSPIEVIDSFDDLLFLASQAFDNNQPYHIDLLPASLLKFQNELVGENIDRLQPALQRALKLLNSSFTSTMGSYDHMLAVFFIDFTAVLICKYPEESKVLRKLQLKYLGKEEVARFSEGFILEECILQTWDTPSHDCIYLPLQGVLLKALSLFIEQSSLSLLSTPTHVPSWVDASILSVRIAAYQEKGETPANIDLQLALSRCNLNVERDEIKLIGNNLSGEYKSLVEFLLLKDQMPEGPFTMEGAWVQAGLVKDYTIEFVAFSEFKVVSPEREILTGQVTWDPRVRTYFAERYNYQTGQYEKEEKKSFEKALNIGGTDWKPSAPNQKPPFIDKIKSSVFGFLGRKKKNEDLVLASLFNLCQNYMTSEKNDVQRFIGMSPNHFEQILVVISKTCLKYSEFWEADQKYLITHALLGLNEIWQSRGKMAVRFIATCMVTNDKTIRSIAGQIWMNDSRMDQRELGNALGLLLVNEYAPVKRLTDLLSTELFKVSKRTDKNILEVLTNIIVLLPDFPLKNSKKLLEIYDELLNSLRVSHSPVIIPKLTNWENTPSLKKVVNGILN
jgi:hypothetical protein